MEEVEYEVDLDIVKIEKIMKYDGCDFSGFFDGAVDSDAAKDAVDAVADLERTLKFARQFGEYASQFCLLEARTYIKISEYEDAEDKLSRREKNLVAWIRTKTSQEIADILEKCARGIRIDNIRNRDCATSRKERSVTECKRISEEIVNEALTTGKTRLSKSRFYEESTGGGKLDPEVVSAFTESTRDKLLRSNVYGVGDGSGCYIATRVCNRRDVTKIVSNRLRSIADDLKSIKQICDENHYRVNSDAIEIITGLAKALGE